MNKHEIALSIIEQIRNHDNETEYEEPQAYIYFDNGRTLEVTHEKNGLAPDKQFYSWRVHCSDEEFDNDLFYRTCGVVRQSISDDLSLATCLEMTEWAMKAVKLTE